MIQYGLKKLQILAKENNLYFLRWLALWGLQNPVYVTGEYVIVIWLRWHVTPTERLRSLRNSFSPS